MAGPYRSVNRRLNKWRSPERSVLKDLCPIMPSPALSHYTIIDLTTQIPGPYCSLLLADFGASIIKVEPPGGDPLRAFPHWFASVNRGKRSAVINLKTEDGKRLIARLFEQADVVLEGFRPGTAQRLGVDYETARTVKPAVVYCSISGFGQDGPYRLRAGHDVNYQAIGGLLGMAEGSDGMPVVPPVLVSDLASGLYASVAVLAALTHRTRTGEGQYIDLSMTDTILSWMSPEIARSGLAGPTDTRPLLSGLPHYQVFKTADGEAITLGIVYEPHFWHRLCDLLGWPEWREWDTEGRMQHAPDIQARLETVFASATRQEWDEKLQAADIPCGPVYRLDELPNDPQFQIREPFFELTNANGETSRQTRPPYRFSGLPDHGMAPPPILGEHTHQILTEAGFSAGEIGDFINRGVIHVSESSQTA